MLAEEYANVYSNDMDGLEILGYSYVGLNDTNKAIQVYSRAVKLGDNDSYEPLAGLAVTSGRLDIVQELLPKLMALKDDRQTPKTGKLHLISILLVYSMKADKKEIFIKTLDGENMKEMLQDDVVKLNLTTGCEFFEGQDIDKIRQEMEAAGKSEAKPPQ